MEKQELIKLIKEWLAKTRNLTPDIAEAIGLLWAAHDALAADAGKGEKDEIRRGFARSIRESDEAD